jgi:acyl-homoserine-lactone acylase
VQFTDNGPVARTVNAASQSDNPESANHADQTRLFSERKTKPVLFADAAIRSDPNVKTIRLCGAPDDAYCQ